MKLDDAQLAHYHERGWLLLERALPDAAVDCLRGELPALFAEDSPRRVLEMDRATVRSVYGTHLTHELFAGLTRHPSLLDPAAQLVGEDVYVYQLKINAKRARSGDLWAWHQDLIYWREEDGLPGGDILNVALFLDDVGDDNAPMRVIPGSHRLGVIETAPREERRAYEESPPWIVDLIAALKYRLDDRTVETLAAERGTEDVRGPRGSLMIFHPNLVHASPPNVSTRDRSMVVVTYNSTRNLPRPPGPPRPEFLVGRDYTPLSAFVDPRLA